MVIALGSTIGTIKDVIDEMREDGKKVGLLGIKAYRPSRNRKSSRLLKRLKQRLLSIERFRSASAAL